MNKITKKLLLEEINKINQRLNDQDRMITELNHALPDPDFDAKCEEQFKADCESLDRHAVRLGLAKTELKKLDQSVFDGQDEKYQWAAVGADGAVYLYTYQPTRTALNISDEAQKRFENKEVIRVSSGGYDTSNWQNSLIKRETAKPKLDIKVGDKIVCTKGLNLTYREIKQGDVYTVTRLPNPDFTAESNGRELWFDFVDDEIRCIFTKKDYAVFEKLEEKPLTASEIALAWLGKQRYILGKVSDDSEDEARECSLLKVVSRSGRASYPFKMGGYVAKTLSFTYCVPYDCNGNEITELPE
ncbi:hypothetical protein [Psychrobacter pygoscelis]|uniref:hypothetical protein n=1 Tax=Psychrobacter pygoscelis TaxID=2488563 RepID=UPI00103AEA79|nr:hypothetical protein [Psychrobacter pygoscelis]